MNKKGVLLVSPGSTPFLFLDSHPQDRGDVSRKPIHFYIASVLPGTEENAEPDVASTVCIVIQYVFQ
ncbi:MAG: hypothetical protein AAF633_03595 [Chloroflexota bacterium]